MAKPKRAPAGQRNARSAARLAAVQALYQMDVAGTDIEAVIGEFVTVRFPAAAEAESADEDVSEGVAEGADATFFAEILRGVVRRQRDIDPAVDQSLAEGWRLVRVDSIETMLASLAKLDPDEPFPLSGLRAHRGKAGRAQEKVALPEGWLDARDDDVGPCVETDGEDVEDALSGG